MNEKVDVLPKVDRHGAPGTEPLFAPTTASAHFRDQAASSGRWVSDEALRLVQQLFLTEDEEKPRVVVFAGIDHGSGCSLVCASVAETLAKNSRRPVCLVDANFRTPSLAQMFGTTNALGLVDAVVQEGSIRLFAENVAEDNLWLISSGPITAKSAGLITSGQLGVRIRELREEFEFVIIDAPPLTPYSDAIAIAKYTNGLVLVLEADVTRRDATIAATANLRSVNIPILAAVLNKREFPIPDNIYKRL